MHTYEMVALAEQNGKTYQVNDTFYQKDRGFYLDDEEILQSYAFEEVVDEKGRRELHAFIMTDGWEEAKVKQNDVKVCNIKFDIQVPTTYEDLTNLTKYIEEILPKKLQDIVNIKQLNLISFYH